MIESPGTIRNEKRLRQIPRFKDGLRFKRPTGSVLWPTDIDAFFEYQGKIAIIIDYKLGSKSLEDGQNKAFTPMADAMQKGGYEGVYILTAEHNTPEDQSEFDGSICGVTAIYHKKGWTYPSSYVSVKDAFLRIFQKHNIDLTSYQSPDYLKMLETII